MLTAVSTESPGAVFFCRIGIFNIDDDVAALFRTGPRLRAIHDLVGVVDQILEGDRLPKFGRRILMLRET